MTTDFQPIASYVGNQYRITVGFFSVESSLNVDLRIFNGYDLGIVEEKVVIKKQIKGYS